MHRVNVLHECTYEAKNTTNTTRPRTQETGVDDSRRAADAVVSAKVDGEEDIPAPVLSVGLLMAAALGG